jgi:hypothetical protein
VARRPFYGETGADSELTARLRKLQEANRVPYDAPPRPNSSSGSPTMDKLILKKYNDEVRGRINPKQVDPRMEDYTYLQSYRDADQQVPPSRMVTNPEEMDARMRELMGKKNRTQEEDQDLMGARQQDVRRYRESLNPRLRKDDQRSLAEDLISMRFKDRAMSLMGTVGSDKEQRREVSDAEDLIVEPNTINVYKKDYGATPSTMAHEYRHFTGSDDGTQNDELFNRIMDTYTAQTPTELSDSISMVIQQEYSLLKTYKKEIEEQNPGVNVEEKKDELIKIMGSLGDSNVNLSQMFNEVLKNSLFSDTFNSFAQRQIKGKYEPSPFLTELLEAQEDRRLAEVKKY